MLKDLSNRSRLDISANMMGLQAGIQSEINLLYYIFYTKVQVFEIFVPYKGYPELTHIKPNRKKLKRT